MAGRGRSLPRTSYARQHPLTLNAAPDQGRRECLQSQDLAAADYQIVQPVQEASRSCGFQPRSDQSFLDLRALAPSTAVVPHP